MEKIIPTKPVLILLYGFPGAGKTFFARQFANAVQAAHLEQDKIRAELFEKPKYSKQENYVVDHIMEYMTEEFLASNISVVFDLNALRSAQRKALRAMAASKGADTLVVWLQIDPDTAYGRSSKRDRRKSDDRYAYGYTVAQFKELATKMQAPKEKETFVVVSGKHTIESQLSSVMKKLTELKIIQHTAASSRMIRPALINLIPTNHQRPQPDGGISGVQPARRNITLR
jgi:predicted kinase